MSDYIEEVNTVLSIQGETVFYDSLEDLEEDLERQSNQYKESAKTWAGASVGLMGSGIFAWLNPGPVSRFLGISEASAMSTDEIITLATAGSLGAAILPAWKANKYRKEYESTRELIDKLENKDFDTSSTEFAYEIVEKLET